MGPRICQWESGCYFGWTPETLADYIRACEEIAAR